MVGIIFGNIDIFFTLVLICLYLGNIFFVRDLFFRFLVFFCSEFISIMNLLFIFYKQDNFLTLLLMNVVFMLLIVYLLFYSKNNKEIVDTPIGANKKSTVILSIIFYLCIFSMTAYSFIKINNKDIINSSDDKLLIYNRNYIKNEHGIDIKNEVMNIKTGKVDYQYIKHPKAFENKSFLKKYNFLIILYTLFVVFMFFISKSHKSINKEEVGEINNEE